MSGKLGRFVYEHESVFGLYALLFPRAARRLMDREWARVCREFEMAIDSATERVEAWRRYLPPTSRTPGA